MKIDLNCDLGESFGRFSLGHDQAVMPFITSANIACGLHAGDPLVMRTTVRLARQLGVALGAHPGWPDLQGFGRREMSFSPDEVEAFILYQLGALSAFVETERAQLRHVKPHGALYNQAAKDRRLSDAIARAVKKFNRDLILIGLAGSVLIQSARDVGLLVANEGFPDRRYNVDMTLTPRSEPNAVLTSPEEVATHALALLKRGVEFEGRRVELHTLCIHGDHPNAVQNAKLLRETLTANGIEVAAL